MRLLDDVTAWSRKDARCAKSATRDDRGRVVEAAVKEKFPPEYNSESTQTVTVEGGSNEFNFEVTTDG